MSFLSGLVVRSPWLFRINAGSCNGCDVELATTAFIPRYDVERLGCKYCGSPRHADIVFITGPLTLRVKEKVLRVWNDIPEPKVTIVVGICPISGGVYRGSHSIEGPVDRYLPVDVNVPGCPPRPQAIMEGVLLAKAIWLERMQLLEEAKKDPKGTPEADKLKAAAHDAMENASREAASGQASIDAAMIEHYGVNHNFGHRVEDGGCK